MTDLEAFTDRPLWDVQRAKMALAALSPDWQNPPSVAFAEDRSMFVNEDTVVGFESDLPGPYTRRYVLQLDDVDYEPAGRLLQ